VARAELFPYQARKGFRADDTARPVGRQLAGGRRHRPHTASISAQQ
jgi:hypothetical protein